MPNEPKTSLKDPARNGSRGASGEWIDRLNLALHTMYFVFYAIGTKTLLCAHVFWGAFLSFVRGPLEHGLRRFGHDFVELCKRAGRWLLKEFCLPVTTLVRAVKNSVRHIRPAFQRSRKDGLTCLLASILYIFVQFFKSLLHLLNYIAPAAAIYVLCVLINYYSTVNYALSIKYDGYTIGYISDLSEYDDAKQMLHERLASINLTEDDVRIGQASYSVVFVPDDQLSTTGELCDEMIQKSISDLTVACGVYVDGEFYGAVEDGDRLKTYLQGRLDAAVAALSASPVDMPETSAADASGVSTDTASNNAQQWSARFIKDIELTEGYYPTAGLVDLDPLLETFDSVVSGEQVYIAQEGDSAWKIAGTLDDVSLDDLYAMNPWMETGNIYPGDEIVIASEVPYLEVQLLAQITYDEEIQPDIERVESNDYNVGYAKVTDEGEPGEKMVVANVVYQNGIEVDREIVSETTVVEPVSGTMVVGTKATGYYTASTTNTGSTTPTSASGVFMWPVDGGYVSCGYGGYYGHKGMDIAAPRGTNIYAADGGLVEVSMRNDSIGYGNYIVINHGNGYKTLYAHCSARYVSAGQYVSKGDVIAAVGMTGWATGNHCHFEIWVNGVKVNPAGYIGTTAW